MSEPLLTEWATKNTPDSSMYYAEGRDAQVEKFYSIAGNLGLPQPTVASTHTSKSILLPVVRYVFPHGEVLLRHNFHDLNLCVLWEFPPQLELSEVYGHADWDWYLEEIKKCEGYSWNGWSEKELADPRILRVEATRHDGSKYWPMPKKPEEKDIWNARMTSPEWYWTQWSGTKLLIEGEMGPGVKLYGAMKAFLQGISNVTPPEAWGVFEPGKEQFTIACGYDQGETLMERLLDQQEVVA